MVDDNIVFLKYVGFQQQKHWDSYHRSPNIWCTCFSRDFYIRIINSIYQKEVVSVHRNITFKITKISNLILLILVLFSVVWKFRNGNIILSNERNSGKSHCWINVLSRTCKGAPLLNQFRGTNYARRANSSWSYLAADFVRPVLAIATFPNPYR